MAVKETKETLEELEEVEIRGHPTEGVFMKCWRCQETHRLDYDGHSGLHCPVCWETLIPIEGPEPVQALQPAS